MDIDTETFGLPEDDSVFGNALEETEIEVAFQALMGINGDKFIDEIGRTGMLSEKSYKTICDNVRHNGRDSIVEYFGVVQYYYFQGK